MKTYLNIACGNRTKESTDKIRWVNIDKYERENKIDLECDIVKHFPFEDNTIDYIYCEQFIEHLNWLDGKMFLRRCFNCLKEGGILRLVFPDYKEIFYRYCISDIDFFKEFFKSLNGDDFSYYRKAYKKPDRLKEERKDSPPPEWHTSSRMKDRRRVMLRCRSYHGLIDIVDWFVHQYGEHKTLYDYGNMLFILTNIGFSEVTRTGIKDIDSHAPTRITSSIYIEAIK